MTAIPSFPLPPPPRGSKMPRVTSPVSFFGFSVFRVFLLAMLVLTMPTQTKANLSSCATSYDPNRDYFPDKVTVTEAKHFGVQYFKNYKLVTNKYTSEVFALYQCGTPAPTGLNATVKVFPIPLTTVAVTTTVDIPYIETLGMRTTIKLVEGPEYVSSPCIQKMITTGVAQALPATYENQTARDILLESVQVIFVGEASSSNKSVSVSTSYDPGVLRRAEWIDFFALFYNAEARANSFFANVSARYECVSEIASTNTTSPKVAWVSYSSYQDDSWIISHADYKLEYVRDASATPVFYSNDAFPNASAWQTAMADVDIVIDETYNGDMPDFYTNFGLNSSSNFKFIKNGQVWRFDKLQSELAALDWFEGAYVNPDAVLEDLLTIFHPSVTFPHTRIWFRDSFRSEGIVVEDAAKCPDYTVIPATRGAECVANDDSPAAFARPAALFTVLLAAVLALLLA